MGYGNWSEDAYKHISTPRRSMTDAAHKAASFRAKTIDPAMNPVDLKLRESRDSAAHPESTAINVFFDVTGSMDIVPVKFAKDKLGKLMQVILDKKALPHPQILFGAIGDANCDRSPFQVGQFESDVKQDEWLTKVHLEAGGGGQTCESYELAYYFAARKTAIDCYEKRGRRGYLFTLGDESYYPEVQAGIIAKVFGDTQFTTMSTAQMLEEAQRRYHVFHIHVKHNGDYDNHPGIIGSWKKLLNERLLILENPDEVCELLAGTIATIEGIDLDATLAALGASKATAGRVSNALVPLRDALAKGNPGSIVGSLPATKLTADDLGTERL